MKRRLVAFLLTGLFLISSAAYAESQLGIEIERLTPITASSPLSGTELVYEIRFQCSAVDDVECKDTVIKVGPFPNEIITGVAGPHPLIASSSFTRGGFLTIVLKKPVWAGTSIAFIIKLATENGRTPDGFTWDVNAVATASNANDAASVSDGKAYAKAEIRVTKSISPNPPLVDSTARYWINACDPMHFTQYGWLFLDDGIVTDTLPTGVEFISASSGGVYDSAANTVIWPAPGLSNKNCGTAADRWIDVKFPSAIFGENEPKITEAENNVTVSALPHGESERISDADQLVHPFTDSLTLVSSGNVAKSALTPAFSNYTFPDKWREDDYQSSWLFGFTNTGNVPVSLEVNDRLPCAYPATGRDAHSSPLDGEALCTDPSFITESISLGSTYNAAVAAGYSPVWTSNNGNIGTFTGSADAMTPAGLPAGDVIAEIKIPESTDILFNPAVFPKTSINYDVMTINGYVPEKDSSLGSDNDWVNGTPITNREDHRLYFDASPVTEWLSSEATIRVLVPESIGAIHKEMSRQHGSKIELSVSDKVGFAPIKGAIVTDLLPAGVTFKSFEGIKEGDFLNQHDVVSDLLYTVEVIDNYNNSGRQLVRVTFNPDVELGLKTITFHANGIAFDERIPGDTINTAQLHLVGDTAMPVCANNFLQANPTLSIRTDDGNDLDGDGATDDRHCSATDVIQAEPTSVFLSSEKYVKGDLDSEFATFPAVGAMSSPGTGTFELRLRNRGSIGFKNLVVYDIFPRLDDTGVKLHSIERKTEFTPTLLSIPVVEGAPGAAVIEYSTSVNPCRHHLNPNATTSIWPAGCVNDWSNTPPSPLSDTTAIRVTNLGELPADPADQSILDNRVIRYDVAGPGGVKPGKVAWNSFALAGERTDGGTFLPTEPPKVGISPPLTDVELAKKVNGKNSDSVYLGEIVDYKITVKHGTTIKVNGDGSVEYENSSGYNFVFVPPFQDVDPDTGAPIENPGSGPEPAPEDRGPLTAPATAKDVVVYDAIPVGLELVPGSSQTFCGGAPKGSFDEATGVWTVGDLVPGDSFSLCYKAKVLTLGEHTNLAEVTIAGGVEDIDSTPGNMGETPEEDDEADAVVTGTPVPVPGIDLKKQVFADGVWHDADSGTEDLPIIPQGQPIKYRFIVTNTGETYLNNVEITDPLIGSECSPMFNSYLATEADSKPPGIQIVGLHSYQWTVECTWPYGWGEGITVNTASVTAESDHTDDPVEDEDTAQVQVIIPGDHYSINKPAPSNADNDTSGGISEGDVLTYTITATNFGTTTLTDLVVTDLLITPSSITCASVAPAGTCVLVGTHTVTNAEAVSGTIVNSATADDGGSHPPVVDIVSSEVTVPEDDSTPGLAIIKPAPVNADNDSSGDITKDDVLTYTITATNTGNVVLNNVVVTDPLITPSSKTCVTLAATATCVLVGTHTVTEAEAKAGTLTNTASANSDETDTPVTDTVSSATTPPDDTPPDNGNEPENIPTLSEYALILLSLLMLIAGRGMSKRRRKYKAF